MLELKDICYTLPDGKEILKHIDLTVRDNEFMVITGPNGGGKSTLAKLIAGIVTPTSGQILLDGQDITHLKEKELRKLRGKEMSVIFQEPMTSLSPVLKIKKQLMEVFDGEPMTKAEKK